nr:carcinoembryonic antigen-related cell adhesion molecule 6-like isoform X2 [Pogona vitticeps]
MPKSRTPSKEACPAYGPYLGYKGPSWPVFLLTGCILSSSCFWLIQAETNIPIKSEPWIPLRESEVTLIPGGVLKNVSACFWYRGDRTNESLIVVYELSPTSQIHYGQAYTKRETIKPNCHLHIANLTAKDNAFFIVHKKSEAAESEVGRVFLLVGAPKQQGRMLQRGPHPVLMPNRNLQRRAHLKPRVASKLKAFSAQNIACNQLWNSITPVYGPPTFPGPDAIDEEIVMK